jgi:plastocyanin
MDTVRHRRNGISAPRAIGLALVPVLLIGLVALTTRNLTAQASLYIKGTAQNKWDPPTSTVGVGDTITWTVTGGSHSLRFTTASTCKAAQESMDFNKPLKDEGDKGCRTDPPTRSGEIVTATVKKALTGNLAFVCGVHPTIMKGTLKPKP